MTDPKPQMRVPLDDIMRHPHLDDHDRIELLAIAIREIGTMLPLIAKHGFDAAVRQYATGSGILRWDTAGQPYLLI